MSTTTPERVTPVRGAKTPAMAPPAVIGVTPKLAGGGSPNPDLVSNIDNRQPTPVKGPVTPPMGTARPDPGTV